MLVMNVDATPEQISQAVNLIESRGLKAHLSRGEERTVIGVVGNNPFIATQGQLFQPYLKAKAHDPKSYSRPHNLG